VPLPLHRQRAGARLPSGSADFQAPRGTRARPDKRILNLEERWESGVALLPHLRTPKLPILASYWWVSIDDGSERGYLPTNVARGRTKSPARQEFPSQAA
jgi:hypothetical protein